MTVATRFTAVAVTALLCASAPAAFAQPQRGQQQQIDLQSALHLRPDQQAAYRAYQAAGPKPEEIARARSAQDLGTLRTPERLDRINALLTTQVAVFQRTSQATRAFYNVLSPDQQHTFDEITAPPPRGGGPRG